MNIEKKKNYSVLRRKSTNKMAKKFYRSFGRGSHSCRICNKKDGLVRRFKLFICRQCFIDNANDLGFSRTI